MNAPVLVLNANFEPINVCNTRRAVGLILSGKADLVMNGRGYIQTVKTIHPQAVCHPLGSNDPPASFSREIDPS